MPYRIRKSVFQNEDCPKDQISLINEHGRVDAVNVGSAENTSPPNLTGTQMSKYKYVTLLSYHVGEVARGLLENDPLTIVYNADEAREILDRIKKLRLTKE